MKISEFVANYIAGLSTGDKKNVYAICGAGAMHLNDAICHHPGIEVIPMQHEQAATYAAECEARVTNNIGVVHVTTGPGGSNAITGVACAYVDSIPLLVIAGQVAQSQSTVVGNADAMGLRQAGMNELDMVALMQPVTKYAKTMTQPLMARYDLEKAVYMATHGRKGPVFLEIPLDIQATEIEPDKLGGFDPVELDPGIGLDYIENAADAVRLRLEQARRPVIIFGNGVRLAGAEDELLRVIDELACPVVSSWTASDILPNAHPSYIGRCGLFGDIPSNYAVQHSDCLLCIGTRLSVAQIGHHPKLFAPDAFKIVVDVDPYEARKASVNADLAVIADAKQFLQAFRGAKTNSEWLRSRQVARDNTAPFAGEPGYVVNAYDFVKTLQRNLTDDAIVVTDVGFSFIPPMQTLKLKAGQRLIHSCGVSPMGWAIPASVGASMADRKRQVICLTGDGGAMMNCQELLTLAQRNLKVIVVVFCNDGYATMRIAQRNHFGRDSISGSESGLNIPPSTFVGLGAIFGFATLDVWNKESARQAVPIAMKTAEYDPVMVVLHLGTEQVIAPRVQAKIVGDKFAPASLTDMWMPEDVTDKLLV